MKKEVLVNKIGFGVKKAGFKLQKHSPEILLVAGIVGVVTSTVLACKATTKVSAILEQTKEDIKTIHKVEENEEFAERYSVEDAKKDKTIVYVQTGLKIAKLYAPSVALGLISLSGMVASHSIMKKRNVAIAAAYATVDKGFKEYRSRVVDKLGEEVDHELRYGIKAATIDKIVTDDKGKEKKTKEDIKVATNPNEYSDYARFFDESCAGWDKNAEYNLMFLKAQMAYANDKLKADGRLFLNDVYEMIGIPKTKAGQVVGWVYDPKNPTGDNFVDFGIYDIHKEIVRDFVNGYERSILLDFNVDGNVWDTM